MRKALSAAYGGVIGLVITAMHDQLFVQSLKWPTSASLAGAVLVGVGLLLAYEIAGGSKLLASRFSPVSRVCGNWSIALTNNSERPTSVCKIYLSMNQIVYRGYGFTQTGEIGSEWTSRHVEFDETQDELSFTADSMIVGKGTRYRSYGYIRFYKNDAGKYEYGDGYFVSLSNDAHQTHMTLTRIDNSAFDKVVTDAINLSKVKNQTALSATP